MEKLTFTKFEKINVPETTFARVSREQHEQIKELSKKTGLSMFAVMGRLLDFAIKNVEIEEA